VFLDVGVGASRPYTGPANRPRTWKALIDTGADMTAISPAVFMALQPGRIGAVPISRAGGPMVWQDTYDLRIRFGGHTWPGPWFDIEAVETQPATPAVDVLIGMDLLVKIDMIWRGSSGSVAFIH
jgi:predicted aspartyl protease